MKTIQFKSTQSNWFKEYIGVKANTLREFDSDDDIREEVLEEFIRGDINMLNIEMVNTDTGEMFTRRVTDVTVWEGTYIISWFHNW